MKAVIIGANAAGMSAASRIKRKSFSWDVVVLEQGYEVSYGACGLPYYVAGLTPELDLIRIRKVEEFKKSGITVKLGCRVTAIDYQSKNVIYTDKNGQEQGENYDKLLIASGSSPKIPPIEGIIKQGIYVLKTPQQAETLKQAILSGCKKIVIVGGGYIGLELAEACALQSIPEIHIVEAMDRLLNIFDSEFSEAVKEELESHGVKVHVGEKVMSFDGDDKVSAVVTDKGKYEADAVVLCIGITPNTDFTGNEIEKIKNGALLTDASMQTSVKDVYAAGDCATTWHKLLDAPTYIALGTNANKQGRMVGDAILGKDICFKRMLGTSMLRCIGLELAKTGFGEQECKANGIAYKTVTVQTRSHARYYPDPSMLTIKLCYKENDHTLLGAQIMGSKEAAWRIDVFACAIDQEMTTEELGFLDLGYAPPFASVWDAIHIAANASK